MNPINYWAYRTSSRASTDSYIVIRNGVWGFLIPRNSLQQTDYFNLFCKLGGLYEAKRKDFNVNRMDKTYDYEMVDIVIVLQQFFILLHLLSSTPNYEIWDAKMNLVIRGEWLLGYASRATLHIWNGIWNCHDIVYCLELIA